MTRKHRRHSILTSDAINQPREDDGRLGYQSEYDRPLRKGELVAIVHEIWDTARPNTELRTDPTQATVRELRGNILEMVGYDTSDVNLDTAIRVRQLRKINEIVRNPDRWDSDGEYVGSVDYDHTNTARREESLEIEVCGEVVYSGDLESGDEVRVDYSA